MKRTPFRGRARGWTVVLVASTSVAASFSVRTALAQDKETHPAEPQDKAPQAEDRSGPAKVPVADIKSTPYSIGEWQVGEPVPPGYHPVQRLRRGAIVAGGIVFGVFYFISTLVAAGQHDSTHGQDTSDAWLYAPVIGPFITMAQTWSAVGNVTLLVDGAAQATGAALLVWGIAMPQTVLVHDDYLGSVRVAARPVLLGKDGAGLGLVGRF